jgi:hypothetical protein
MARTEGFRQQAAEWWQRASYEMDGLRARLTQSRHRIEYDWVRLRRGGDRWLRDLAARSRALGAGGSLPLPTVVKSGMTRLGDLLDGLVGERQRGKRTKARAKAPAGTRRPRQKAGEPRRRPGEAHSPTA